MLRRLVELSSGERIIRFFEGQGYDFDSLTADIYSRDDIDKKIRELKKHADKVSKKSNKPMTERQRAAFHKILDTEVKDSIFNTALEENEAEILSEAEEYSRRVGEARTIEELEQIEDFSNVHPDVATHPTVVDASVAKERKRTELLRRRTELLRREDIQRKAQEARKRKYEERYANAEQDILNENAESIHARGVRTPSSLIKIHVPNRVLRERGEEYDRYIELAKQVLIREGITDESGRYIRRG